MSKFQIIIRKFWIRVEKPIWSFIVNCFYWWMKASHIKGCREELDHYRTLPLAELMTRFQWTKEKVDWTQWPSTLIDRDMKGDCDDAAQLAKWWFKQNGIEAEILNLYSESEGHTICVTKDRTKMVSNGNVIELNPATWEQDVMKYFGNEYEVMF